MQRCNMKVSLHITMLTRHTYSPTTLNNRTIFRTAKHIRRYTRTVRYKPWQNLCSNYFSVSHGLGRRKVFSLSIYVRFFVIEYIFRWCHRQPCAVERLKSSHIVLFFARYMHLCVTFVSFSHSLCTRGSTVHMKHVVRGLDSHGFYRLKPSYPTCV